MNELRTLITRVYDLPTSFDNWHEFEDILLNCSDLQPPLEELGVGVGPHSKEVSRSGLPKRDMAGVGDGAAGEELLAAAGSAAEGGGQGDEVQV